MSDDIVERGYNHVCNHPACIILADEMAAEIERLRTAEFVGRLPDYVKELEAEIERLRELLDDLAGDHCPSHAAPVVGCSVCEWVRMTDE